MVVRAVVVLFIGLVALAGCNVQPYGVALRLAPDREREGRRVYVLTEDWLYCYPKENAIYKVPMGFETDFASIPQAVRWLIADGRSNEPALLHDYLYAIGRPGDDAARKRADDIFLAAMEDMQVPAVTRMTMYEAVREGGRSAYGRAGEWTNFADPQTTARACPPFAKPANAIAEFFDCRNFAASFPKLRRTLVLNQAPPQKNPDGSCGPNPTSRVASGG